MVPCIKSRDAAAGPIGWAAEPPAAGAEGVDEDVIVEGEPTVESASLGDAMPAATVDATDIAAATVGATYGVTAAADAVVSGTAGV
jgi:hypothetical protein